MAYSRQLGLSLVELMIATALAAIVLMAAQSLVQQAYRLHVTAADMQANQAAASASSVAPPEWVARARAISRLARQSTLTSEYFQVSDLDLTGISSEVDLVEWKNINGRFSEIRTAVRAGASHHIITIPLYEDSVAVNFSERLSSRDSRAGVWATIRTPASDQHWRLQ